MKLNVFLTFYSFLSRKINTGWSVLSMKQTPILQAPYEYSVIGN